MKVRTASCIASGLIVASGMTFGIQAQPPAAPAPTDGYPDLPAPVASFGAATLEGWLYVYGGHQGRRHVYSREDVSGAFQRLNLTNPEAWQALPGGQPVQGTALVAFDQALYRIGGMAAVNARGESHDLQSTATVDRFDVRHGTWEAIAPLPSARSSHDATVLGHTLYVAGGWRLDGGEGSGTWQDSMWMLDLSQPDARWEAVPQPFRRRALAVIAFEGKVFCLGGMDEENDTSLAVDIYNPTTGAWSRGPDLPAGRMSGFGGAAVVQAGGLYFSGFSGELHRLAVDGSDWEPAGRLQFPRFFHQFAPVGSDGLVAIAGEDSESKRQDLEYLDLTNEPATTQSARRDSSEPGNAVPQS